MKIHKYVARVQKKLVVYFMITSEEVSNLDYTMYPKDNQAILNRNTTSTPALSPANQIGNTTIQIGDDHQITVEGNTTKTEQQTVTTSDEPSATPTETPNLDTVSTPVPAPTTIRDNEFNLTEDEIKLLFKSWDNTTKHCSTNLYISSSFHLDFDVVPCPDIRNGGSGHSIPVHDTKQADEGTKWHFLVQLAKYNYMMLTKKERIYLAESVGRRESYLCGYKTPFSARTLMRWWTEHETNHQYSVEIQDMFKSKVDRKEGHTWAAFKFSTRLFFINYIATLQKHLDIIPATTALGN